MADTITSSNVLKLNALFADNDTRTLTLDDPKAGVTAAEINALAESAKAGDVLIGDKTGAKLVRFTTAKKVKKETTELDFEAKTASE